MAGPSRSGVRRKVDDLGRVVIPASIRKTLGLVEGDELEFSLDGDRVVLARPVDECVFCGATQHLEEFRDRVVCWSCLAALHAVAREAPPPSPFGA